MVRQPSALLVGEVSPGEAFQRRAELICLGHPSAETLADGDRQVPRQQLRLGGQAIGEFLRPWQHLVEGKHLGYRAPLLGLLGGERALGQGQIAGPVLRMETEPVKAKVRAFWDLARRQVLGAPIPAARPWGSPRYRMRPGTSSAMTRLRP